MSDASETLARLLAAGFASNPDEAESVRRILGTVEAVTLRLRRDDHLELACLEFLGGHPKVAASSPDLLELLQRAVHSSLPRAGAGELPTRATDVARSTALRREVPAGQRSLAAALADLFTATMRVGLRHASTAPAVREAVDRLQKELDQRTSDVGSRWLARLMRALQDQHRLESLALLHEAARVSGLLAGPSAASGLVAEEAELLAMWLPSAGESSESSTRCEDDWLLEVGVERLRTVDRGWLLRRVLLRLSDGILLCEEGRVGAAGMSQGPTPRLVHAGLAEVSNGSSPRRVALLQYAVEARVDHAHWAASTHFTLTRWRQLRTLLEPAPSAEPLALFAPKALHWRNASPVLEDEDGCALTVDLETNPGLAAALHRATDPHEVCWWCVRLVLRDSGPTLIPLSLLLRAGEAYHFWRAV